MLANNTAEIRQREYYITFYSRLRSRAAPCWQISAVGYLVRKYGGEKISIFCQHVVNAKEVATVAAAAAGNRENALIAGQRRMRGTKCVFGKNVLLRYGCERL